MFWGRFGYFCFCWTENVFNPCPWKTLCKVSIFFFSPINFFSAPPPTFFFFFFGKCSSLLVTSIWKHSSECQETSAKIYWGSGFSDNWGLFLCTLRKYMFHNITHKLFKSLIPESPFRWKHLPKALIFNLFFFSPRWQTRLLSCGIKCLPTLCRPGANAGWVCAVEYGLAMGTAGLSPWRIVTAGMVPRFSWVPGHVCSSI